MPDSAAGLPKGALSDDAHQVAQLYAGFASTSPSPLVPNFDDAVRLRRLLEALVESSEAGRRIEW